MSKKLNGLSTKRLVDPTKNRYVLRFHNDNRNRFVDTSERYCFFIFEQCCQNIFIWAENFQNYRNLVSLSLKVNFLVLLIYILYKLAQCLYVKAIVPFPFSTLNKTFLEKRIITFLTELV